VPRQDGARALADHERARQGERVEDAHHVADEVEDGVGGRRRRGRRVAVASEVRGHAAVAPRREGQQRVLPRVPELQEAVQEEHRAACGAAVAGLGYVDLDAVHLQRPVGYALRRRRRRHLSIYLCCFNASLSRESFVSPCQSLVKYLQTLAICFALAGLVAVDAARASSILNLKSWSSIITRSLNNTTTMHWPCGPLHKYIH